MQSSRDSSIWRNLAVAFGDGVAFGVGVKLAQGANRRPADAPPADTHTTAERLEQFEQRLATIENAPLAAAPPAPAPFDQKVLEAVVNALDARLHEQSGQTERRITELEAKFAIELKNLDRKDHALSAGLRARLQELHGQYNEHVTAIRDAVAQDMDALYAQLAEMRQAMAANSSTALEARLAAAANSRFENLENRLRGQVREVATQAMAQASSAATAAAEAGVKPVREALAEKDREIAELRQRVAESEQTVLDLILAIGQMCRQVADRIAGQEAPSAKPPDEPPAAGTGDPAASSEPNVDEAPPAPAPGIAATTAGAGPNGDAAIPPLPMVAAQSAAPAFEQVHGPSHLWRVPLVSSFLILAAGSLWMLK